MAYNRKITAKIYCRSFLLYNTERKRGDAETTAAGPFRSTTALSLAVDDGPDAGPGVCSKTRGYALRLASTSPGAALACALAAAWSAPSALRRARPAAPARAPRRCATSLYRCAEIRIRRGGAGHSGSDTSMLWRSSSASEVRGVTVCPSEPGGRVRLPRLPSMSSRAAGPARPLGLARALPRPQGHRPRLGLRLRRTADGVVPGRGPGGPGHRRRVSGPARCCPSGQVYRGP